MTNLSAVRHAGDNNDLAIDISLDKCSHSDFYEVINVAIIRPATLKGIPIFQFKLINVESGKIAIMFFNANETKNGFKVPHDGKFAKLYRLTFGENPKARYSKAEQLLSHFIGERLKCQIELSKYENGDAYMKVLTAEPLHPIVKDEWTATGALKGKNRRRNSSKKVTSLITKDRNKAETTRKANGTTLENKRKKNGNTNKAQTPIKSSPRQTFQSQINNQGNADNGKAVNIHVNTTNTIPYMTPNSFNGYSFARMPAETTEQLYERAIIATF
jgi:hypothetical protein